jgi:outer membrane protein
MKALLVASVLTLTLVAAPALAQAPAGQAPAQPPAAAAAPARPFPEGARVAYVNIQRIANESAEGKAATAKVKALNDKKVLELGEKNKSLQTAQQKLQQSMSVLSDSARGQLEKDIEKLQVEIQRYTQDAQAEVQELQQELQGDFQKKLLPVLNAVAAEKGLHMVLSQVDSGLVWADPGLDITADVVKRFDSATAPAAPAPKPQGQ